MNERLNLKMVVKGDSGPTVEAEDMFSLKQIHNDKELKRLQDQSPDDVAYDSDASETKSRNKYERYSTGESHLDSTGTYYKDSDSELEMETDESDVEETPGKLGLSDSESDNEETAIDDGDDKKHPLITDLDHRDSKQKKTHKAELWFERDAFKDLLDEKDEDEDLDRLVDEYKKKGTDVIGEEKKKDKEEKQEEKINTDTDTDSDSEEETNHNLTKNQNENNKATTGNFFNM